MGSKTAKRSSKRLSPTSDSTWLDKSATSTSACSATAALEQTAAALQKVKVTFLVPISDAKCLMLSGDFNGWSQHATPMKRYADGHWEATVDLLPGRYEYKFVRDGEWIPDLLASEYVWNPYGTLNSVVQVRHGLSPGLPACNWNPIQLPTQSGATA